MTWKRLVYRNGLRGGYDGVAGYKDDIGTPQWGWMEPDRYRDDPRDPQRPPANGAMIAGDMRRVEADQRDARHLDEYAKRAGITPEQARAVLDAFFEADL
jgi:hypothetical protein